MGTSSRAPRSKKIVPVTNVQGKMPFICTSFLKIENLQQVAPRKVDIEMKNEKHAL